MSSCRRTVVQLGLFGRKAKKDNQEKWTRFICKDEDGDLIDAYLAVSTDSLDKLKKSAYLALSGIEEVFPARRTITINGSPYSPVYGVQIYVRIDESNDSDEANKRMDVAVSIELYEINDDSFLVVARSLFPNITSFQILMNTTEVLESACHLSLTPCREDVGL